jgi:hypothetical protein
MTCGQCGGAIITVNAERYGCAARKDRGLAVCAGVYVRKDIAEERIIGALRGECLEPATLAELQAAVREVLKERLAPVDHSKRLAELEADIGRLVDALMALGSSPAITSKLKTLESEKARLEAEKAIDVQDIKIPNVRKLLEDLEEVLRTDIDRARAIIAEMLGKVTIRKEDGGVYAYLETKTQALLQASGYPIMVAGAGFQNKIRLDR